MNTARELLGRLIPFEQWVLEEDSSGLIPYRQEGDQFEAGPFKANSLEDLACLLAAPLVVVGFKYLFDDCYDNTGANQWTAVRWRWLPVRTAMWLGYQAEHWTANYETGCHSTPEEALLARASQVAQEAAVDVRKDLNRLKEARLVLRAGSNAGIVSHIGDPSGP